jgi:hypothetical protein
MTSKIRQMFLKGLNKMVFPAEMSEGLYCGLVFNCGG